MRQNIMLAAMLLLITAKLNAQADERIYFNNGNWETGVILELIPDSTVTLKKESGDVESYSMRDVRKIIKRFHETLNVEIPNQTISGAVSINGGIYVAKYEGSYYHIIFNPSFNFFTTTNLSFGMVVSAENTSKGFSLNNALYRMGGSVQYFFDEKPSKPFMGLEIVLQSENDMMFEASVFAGHNYAISKNLAIQPAIKLGFIDFDKTGMKHTRITLGVGIANYIF